MKAGILVKNILIIGAKAWVTFVTSLPDEGLYSMVEHIVVAVIPFSNFEEEVTQIYTNIFETRFNLLRKSFKKIPFVPRQPEYLAKFAQIYEDSINLNEMPLEKRIDILFPVLNNNSLKIRTMAVQQITELLENKYNDVPFTRKRVICKLLTLLLKGSMDNDENASILFATALGKLGALNIDYYDIESHNESIFLTKSKDEIGVNLITDYLVKLYKRIHVYK